MRRQSLRQAIEFVNSFTRHVRNSVGLVADTRYQGRAVRPGRQPISAAGGQSVRADGVVQRDHTEGHVPPDHFGPAGSGDDPGQRRLVGPGVDRLLQVGVGLRIGGDPPGQQRQHVAQVPAVPPADRRRPRPGELADQQLAAGAGDPGELLQRGAGILDVAQAERDGHRVERPSANGRCMASPATLGSRKSGFGRGQHAEREVGGDAPGPGGGQRLGGHRRCRPRRPAPSVPATTAARGPCADASGGPGRRRGWCSSGRSVRRPRRTSRRPGVAPSPARPCS